MHLMLVYIVFSALAELKIKLPQYAYATCQETDQPLDGLAIDGMLVDTHCFFGGSVCRTHKNLKRMLKPREKKQRLGHDQTVQCFGIASLE